MSTEFAGLVESWPDPNLLSALAEYADDYQVDQLVVVLAETRRRGLEAPAWLLELEPGSESEREAISSLQSTRAEEDDVPVVV